VYRLSKKMYNISWKATRTRTSMNTRAFTTNLILKKRRNSSVWLVTTTKIATSRMPQVMTFLHEHRTSDMRRMRRVLRAVNATKVLYKRRLG
jgi:hypothetical protein